MSSFVFIKKDKCQQFWSIPLLGERWCENFFPWMWWFTFPLHVVCNEGIISTSKKSFQTYCTTIIISNIIFNMAFNLHHTLMKLRKPKG
jgi:hypothetical protein